MPETPPPQPTENDLLQALTIRDFKGIDHLEIPTLKRVNLLTGFNNTGKTSVLHAIAFLLDAPYWQAYQQIPASFFQRILPLYQQATYKEYEDRVLCSIQSHDKREVCLKTPTELSRALKDTLKYDSFPDKPELETSQTSSIEMPEFLKKLVDISRIVLKEQNPNFSESQIEEILEKNRQTSRLIRRLISKNSKTHEVSNPSRFFDLTEISSERKTVITKGDIPISIYFNRSSDYADVFFENEPKSFPSNNYLKSSLHLTSQHLLKLATVFKKKQA
ncbi:MAG: AAA family ATPase, partial [Vampirovibrionales bacterium]